MRAMIIIYLYLVGKGEKAILCNFRVFPSYIICGWDTRPQPLNNRGLKPAYHAREKSYHPKSNFRFKLTPIDPAHDQFFRSKNSPHSIIVQCNFIHMSKIETII